MLVTFTFRGATFRANALDVALAGAGGRSWYRDAHASIEEYAGTLGLDPGRVCDVLALLSPRVSVVRNVAMAHAYLTTGEHVRGTMAHRKQALARYERTGVITGPKVEAFARALRGDPSAVVVDSWAYRLLGDTRTPGDKHYRDVAQRIEHIAERLSWQPAETQAALWVGTRAAVGFHDVAGKLAMPEVSI